MDRNLLKYQAFINTVEYGSFTRAAEVLGCSQSAVSKMISDLEKEWNVILLERAHNGVKLTSDGKELSSYINTLYNDFRELRNRVGELNNLSSGIIRIGVLTSVAVNWMPNIIRAFHNDYPNVEFEMLLGDYGQITQWVTEGRVECGFLHLPVLADFDIMELEKDELKVILPKQHPLAQKEVIDIDDLNDVPFVMLEGREKTEVEEFLEQYHIRPMKKVSAQEDYTIMAMVEGGLGVSILPELILKRIPFDLEIRPLSISAFRTVVFVVRNQKIISLAVKRFMDYLPCR